MMRLLNPRRSTGMAVGLLLPLVIGAGSLVLPLPLQGQDLSGDVSNGKRLYEQHCLRCHGAAGWGDGPLARELKVPPANFHSPFSQMKTAR
ncbi:MAG: c-type cytochrome [Nitrospirae bacterium]|nr:c-type cytochrome [Nitrospirota bacterium]